MVTSRIRIVAVSVLLAAAAGRCSASHEGGHLSPSPPSSSEPATSSFADPTGLALDAGGNLWVCNYRGSNMLMFSAAALAGSAEGGPAASVVISGLRGPNDLAFDRAGTLWVVDYDAGLVAGYLPSQLAASGEPSPSIVIGSNGAALSAPTWLAFDSKGWM
jgi:sugar lactone lactonase YvrE